MYLANISSAAVLLLFIGPSLAYSCCGVDANDIIYRRTQYTKKYCAGIYIPNEDLCKITDANQKVPLVSCCTDGGKRSGIKLCNGECVEGKWCYKRG
ncbi:hypothetical protein Vi05172_g8063 [Venturia inaequalis]|nr:hypothetical protein Vi05172_g8063 [Venturia inaequalis]